jgi:hypothetical protein
LTTSNLPITNNLFDAQEPVAAVSVDQPEDLVADFANGLFLGTRCRVIDAQVELCKLAFASFMVSKCAITKNLLGLQREEVTA